MQSFKQAMKAAKQDSGMVQSKLSKFLIMYRNSPHSTTGECPSSLFLGRRLATRLDLIKPSLGGTVSKSQSKMVRSTFDRNYDIGQSVSVKDYRNNETKWIPGVIREKTGPVSYRVEVAPEVAWRRHADQIQDSNIEFHRGIMTDVNLPEVVKIEDKILSKNSEQVKTPSKVQGDVSSPSVLKPQMDVPVERRYPVRERRKPIKLDL